MSRVSRQLKSSRVDRRVNNSEVINSCAALSADHSAHPQGLSPPWSTPTDSKHPRVKHCFELLYLRRRAGAESSSVHRHRVQCRISDAVYKERCGVRGLCRWKYVENARLGKEDGTGCHRPCKNKELVFFLVRKSVNTGGVFATLLLVAVCRIDGCL